MSEKEKLEQAIAALEAQRSILGDEAVNTSISALREKLNSLEVRKTTEEQRKQVTVLFADISGFTAMSEKLDAEEVTGLINELWNRLDKTIIGHGGIIDKHIGDNVMALWGTAAARENDPERAVRAALSMQKEIEKLYEERKTGSAGLRLRIGINTGPVLLGKMGTTGEYTAMGDTVNTASRLEGKAPVGGILISHDTYRHIRGIFNVDKAQPIEVKGKSEPVRAYIVKGAKPRSFTMSSRGVEGIETRMVGRETELGILKNAFKDVIGTNTLRVVSIVGEAGIGKSRLLYEFENWLEIIPESVLYLKGRAAPEMQDVHYGIIRDMFAFRFKILESDSADTVREKLHAAISGAIGPDRTDVVGYFLGFDIQSDAVENLVGSSSFAQIATADLAMCLKWLINRPAVLFMEDIHWADNGSVKLLEQMAVSLEKFPLLIVTLARPSFYDRHPEWLKNMPWSTVMNLSLLSREDSGILVREILQKVDNIPEKLQKIIVEGAEGNPYYLEELIKMLLDDGVIVRGETWRIEPGRLENVNVPPTLTGVLQARLDSLPRNEKLILQRASVVGRLFWEAAVVMLESGALDENDEIPSLLDAVSKKELVFKRDRSAFEGTREYIFKHAILRDVTYETVLLKLRKIYHSRTASWLEQNMKERASEFLSLIARHYELAGETEKAADYLIRWSDDLYMVSAFNDAISALDRALAMLPEGDDIRKAGIHVKLGVAYRQISNYPEARKYSASGADLAEQAGDLRLKSEALCGVGWGYMGEGNYDSAEKHLREALNLAREYSYSDGIANAAHHLGDIAYRRGNTDEAGKFAEEALPIFRTNGDRQGEARTLRVMGFAELLKKNYDGAVEFHRKSKDICEETGDRWGIATAYINMGESIRKDGRFEEAVEYFKLAIPIAEEVGTPLSILICHLNIGSVYAEIGEAGLARHHLQKSITESYQIGALAITLEGLVAIALLHVKAGEHEKAARLIGFIESHPSFNAEIKQYSDAALKKIPAVIDSGELNRLKEEGRTTDINDLIASVSS